MSRAQAAADWRLYRLSDRADNRKLMCLIRLDKEASHIDSGCCDVPQGSATGLSIFDTDRSTVGSATRWEGPRAKQHRKLMVSATAFLFVSNKSPCSNLSNDMRLPLAGQTEKMSIVSEMSAADCL